MFLATMNCFDAPQSKLVDLAIAVGSNGQLWVKSNFKFVCRVTHIANRKSPHTFV
jgi:exosome complex RNA-binding protein Rrp4